MHFVAIDFETANSDYSSICSIGLAEFQNGQKSAEWYSLINPKTYFDPRNIDVHGITKSDIKNAPSFVDVNGKLRHFLQNKIVVTHSAFDRAALQRATAKWKIEDIQCHWLDTARLARRTWPQFSKRGYGLKSICEFLQYEFEHHHALEDAKASAFILLQALDVLGLTIDQACERIRQPLDPSAPSYSASIHRNGNPDGPLAGEKIVFTGALQFPRKEVATIAAQAGCDVSDSVTRKTTILVVGDQDLDKLAGHEKSSKHRKAESLREKGLPIKIIQESDFMDICNFS
ncbi:MAG: exonuclease domain-containing protein [Sphingomonadales bacterium]|jgi:DNA polymerase-3 subunit epsilon